MNGDHVVHVRCHMLNIAVLKKYLVSCGFFEMSIDITDANPNWNISFLLVHRIIRILLSYLVLIRIC